MSSRVLRQTSSYRKSLRENKENGAPIGAKTGLNMTTPLRKRPLPLKGELKSTIKKTKFTPATARRARSRSATITQGEGDTVQAVVRVRPTKCSNANGSITINGKTLTLKESHKVEKTFCFDHVFDQYQNQSQVFETIGKKVANNWLNGFDAAIIAYGQTGSGKTHTMEGEKRDPGLIPRIFDYTFDRLLLKEQTRPFKCELSYFQIYNEHVLDLLAKEERALHEKAKGLTVLGSGDVKGLDVKNVRDSKEAKELFKMGKDNRATGSTAMNNVSSRSHSVLVLNLERDSTEGTQCSKLFLVDLAGSEKQKQTKVGGAKLKEAGGINSSLTCLSTVITALVDEKPFINYRDSKLTLVLQDCFKKEGSAKTWVINTINPRNLAMTQSTLNFAHKLKSYTRGPAVRRPKIINWETEAVECKQEVKRLREEIARMSGTQGSNIDAVVVSNRNLTEELASIQTDDFLSEENAQLQEQLSATQAEKDRLASQLTDNDDLLQQLEALQQHVLKTEEDSRAQLIAAQEEIERLKTEKKGEEGVQGEEEIERREDSKKYEERAGEDVVELQEKLSNVSHKLQEVIKSRNIVRSALGQHLQMASKLNWAKVKMGSYEEEKDNLEQQLEQLSVQLLSYEEERADLEQKLQSKECALKLMQKKLHNLQKASVVLVNKARVSEREQKQQQQLVEQERNELQAKTQRLQKMAENLEAHVQRLESNLKMKDLQQQNLNVEKQNAEIRALQSEFSDKKHLCEFIGKRRLVKTGVLNKISQKTRQLYEYKFFLFDDALIYAENIKKKNNDVEKLKLHRLLHLGLCRLVDLQNKNTVFKNCFQIMSAQKSFTVSCDSAADKKIWLDALQAQIKETIESEEEHVIQVPPQALDVDDLATMEYSMSMESQLEETRARGYSNSESKCESDSESEYSVSRSRASRSSRNQDFRKEQAYCELCVNKFDKILKTRRKTTCKNCGTKYVCKKCCNKEWKIEKDGKRKSVNVCKACYGGLSGNFGPHLPILVIDNEKTM